MEERTSKNERTPPKIMRGHHLLKWRNENNKKMRGHLRKDIISENGGTKIIKK